MKYGKTIIAVVLLLALAVMVTTIYLPYAIAEPVDTYHSRWHLVRAMASEDIVDWAAEYGYDLTGVRSTNGDFASKDSSTVLNGGPFRIRSLFQNRSPGHEGYSAGGAWMFTICGKNYNDVDDDFSFTIVGWSKENGMLQVIAHGDGILGTQAVIKYPEDGSDALGALISLTGVAYDDGTEVFTEIGEFGDAAVGMMARITGSGFTDEICDITAATADTITCDVTVSTGDCTDATVQINPAFWVDTISLDATTKWPSVAVYNSGNDEVAFVLMDTTGLEWIQWLFYDASGDLQSDEASDISVYGRRY